MKESIREAIKKGALDGSLPYSSLPKLAIIQ